MSDRSTEPLRIGVLGAANIARLFIAGVRPSKKLAVTTVASRDAAKARAFADENGVAGSHGSYEALLADPDIDAIYNPLPNNLHAEWTIKALQAGKHVLCEKPIAATAAEARAMYDAARATGLHMVEAYPYRSQPQTLKTKELVHAGAIGRLKLIRADFGFKLPQGTNIRLDPALAGGALMDAGAYPISLVRMLTGERPSRVSAVAQWAPSGVDITLMGTLEFPSGVLAQISGSFATARIRNAWIAGDAGGIETSYSNHTPANHPAILLVKRGTTPDTQYETLQLAETDGFLAEAESFAELVRTGRGWNGITEAESIDNMLTIEAMLQSAREGRFVELPRL